MPEKLKPCPACGTPGDTLEVYPVKDGFYQVVCWDCFMRETRRLSPDKAIKTWNAMPRPLRWTKEPPTKPGYYWHEKDHEKQPVYVFRAATPEGEKALYTHFFGEGDVVHKIERMSGKWAGPIPEPKSEMEEML